MVKDMRKSPENVQGIFYIFNISLAYNQQTIKNTPLKGGVFLEICGVQAMLHNMLPERNACPSYANELIAKITLLRFQLNVNPLLFTIPFE